MFGTLEIRRQIFEDGKRGLPAGNHARPITCSIPSLAASLAASLRIEFPQQVTGRYRNRGAEAVCDGWLRGDTSPRTPLSRGVGLFQSGIESEKSVEAGLVFDSIANDPSPTPFEPPQMRADRVVAPLPTGRRSLFQKMNIAGRGDAFLFGRHGEE